MKVVFISGSTPVHNLSFQGKIIDAHTHVGVFLDGIRHTVDNFTPEDIVDISKQPINSGQDTLDKVIVSNIDGFPQSPKGFEDVLSKKGINLEYLSEYDANMRLHKMCQENPLLKLLAVCQPERHSDAEEIRRVLKDGEFFGLKFHPEYTKIGAENSAYEPYMKLAEEFNLPCLFHCDANGSKYSSPEQIYELAKRHPKVPVILAHLGAGPDEVHQKAIDVMLESIKNRDARIYADISWVNCEKADKTEIVSAIKQLKESVQGDMTSRLLFGTDAPLGNFGAEGFKEEGYYSKNIADIKSSIKKAFPKESEIIINKLFYQNAQDLFFSREDVQNIINHSEAYKRPASQVKALKYLLGLTTILGLTFGAIYYIRNKLYEKFN